MYQHIWHQTKFQRRLHTPVNKYFSFFLRMFTLKSRVTAKFEDDEEGIKLHVWLERASVKGCLVLRKKFQVDIAWSNFKTWQHCHTNYLHRWLKWHFSITAKNLVDKKYSVTRAVITLKKIKLFSWNTSPQRFLLFLACSFFQGTITWTK